VRDIVGGMTNFGFIGTASRQQMLGW
jgi:hypothetical protein